MFGDRERLAWLEGLLHLIVSREYLEWRKQLAQLDEPPRVCVTEVPLLFEVGAETRFDKVVVITAPKALREQRRRVARDDRDARLPSIARRSAGQILHYVNTGSFEDLRVGRRGDGGARGGSGRPGVRRSRLPRCSPWPRRRRHRVGRQPEPEWYERIRHPLRYETIVPTRWNYDLPPTLLAAVIYTERFDASARLNAGAVGLMQPRAWTRPRASLCAPAAAFVVDDLLDPEINVRYGSWYLRHLLDRYDDTATALAAYHAGQGNVDRRRRAGVGIQFPETRAYVARVLAAQKVYADAYTDELSR